MRRAAEWLQAWRTPASSREPDAPPPVLEDQHHAERVEFAISLEQSAPHRRRLGIVLVRAVHHFLVCAHGAGTLVDVLQHATDFEWWKRSVRIARLVGDHARPRLELAAHRGIGFPESVE